MKLSFVTVITAVALLLLSASCDRSDRRSAVYPKPEAYPRVAVLDSTYASSDSIDLRFDTNTSAVVKIRSSYWFDIVYPCYGATVYVTISRVRADSVDAVIENRRRRLKLNTGDSDVEISGPVTSGEFTSYIYRSPSVRSTPLQFLSTDGRSRVVSGTVFFGNTAPDSPVDSLAPMVAQIERDLTHSLSNLSTR